MAEDLRKKINSILYSDDIVSNEQVISAYDLVQTINYVLGDIRKLLRKDEFIDRLNKQYIYTKDHQLQENRFYFPWLNNLLGKPTVLYFFSWITETNFLYLKFILRIYNHTIAFSINKEVDSELLFYNWIGVNKERDKDIVKNFISDNLEIINEMFSIMEEFYNQFDLRIKNAKIKSCDNIQSLTDGFFRVDMNIANGVVKCDLSLEDSSENAGYYKKWLLDKKLQKEIEQNKELYLKKIGIDIEKLNDLYKRIIFINNEKNKVKSLNI